MMNNFDGVGLTAGIEIPYQRRAQGLTTTGLLADAVVTALDKAGLTLGDVDGLAVASFTHGPDRAVDLAWRLGMTLDWVMDDSNGGMSGINLIHHAARAVQSGDASLIVVVAGDHFETADFARLIENYNATTRDYLGPMQAGAPNSLFAMLTSRYAALHGLERADFGTVAVAQRKWAIGNPQAVYRTPLSLPDYLQAPLVADPLGRFDCVPVVSGANALIVTTAERARRLGASVGIRALGAKHNVDNQQGDGLSTGLAQLAPRLWQAAAMRPDDIDVVSIYDDYPVMVLVQLQDLGFLRPGETVKSLIHERILTQALAVNTSGGQLSAGQAGAACGLHGVVEAMTQLSGQAQARQVAHARRALVTGYGMVQYRYGMCSNALILETA